MKNLKMFHFLSFLVFITFVFFYFITFKWNITDFNKIECYFYHFNLHFSSVQCEFFDKLDNSILYSFFNFFIFFLFPISFYLLIYPIPIVRCSNIPIPYSENRFTVLSFKFYGFTRIPCFRFIQKFGFIFKFIWKNLPNEQANLLIFIGKAGEFYRNEDRKIKSIIGFMYSTNYKVVLVWYPEFPLTIIALYLSSNYPFFLIIVGINLLIFILKLNIVSQEIEWLINFLVKVKDFSGAGRYEIYYINDKLKKVIVDYKTKKFEKNLISTLKLIFPSGI